MKPLPKAAQRLGLGYRLAQQKNADVSPMLIDLAQEGRRVRNRVEDMSAEHGIGRFHFRLFPLHGQDFDVARLMFLNRSMQKRQHSRIRLDGYQARNMGREGERVA